MTLSRAQAKQLTKKVLDQASFGDVRVSITERRTGNARFAGSAPTTSGDVTRLEISVTAAKDGRHATAVGNRTDEASLAALVRKAEALAELAPPDPEFMPPLGKTGFASVNASDRKVAKMTGAERSAMVEAVVQAGQREGTEVSGYLEHEETVRVAADRRGLFGYFASTQLSLTCTCRTPDATGSARRGFVSHSQLGLDAAALASETARWALRSRSPAERAPGRITAVLAPEAVAELMSFFIESMDHRRAVEGRSYFAEPGGGTKIGQKLFDERVRLWSDPTDRRNPAAPLTAHGEPHPKVVWVEGGVLKALPAERYWAEKANVPAIPEPSSFHMAGGTQSLDELVSTVERGVLVTRFWYNRMLARESILVTGLTRDGTFAIEKGRIVGPVNNFRYNESPITLLQKASAFGRPVRAGFTTERVMVVPPMVVEDFNFESRSDAV